MLRDTERAGAMALTGCAIAAVAVQMLPEGSSLRVVLVLGFLAVCPGMAVMRLIQPGRLELWILAVALSLAIDQVVAMTMMYAGVWNSLGAVVGLAMITTALAWVPTAVAYLRGHSRLRVRQS